jgi:hypothetical protein
MPCYRITYTRLDMPSPCGAIKTAHTEDEAIKCLTTGSKTKGYKLKKTNVPITITNITELN